MVFEISLTDLRFYGFHGVLEEERQIGNQYVVTLKIRVPHLPAIDSDDITSTVSYADLYEIVNEEMSIPRNLLETVCIKIARRIKDRYHTVETGEVEIEKVVPPIPGMIGNAKVKLLF